MPSDPGVCSSCGRPAAAKAVGVALCTNCRVAASPDPTPGPWSQAGADPFKATTVDPGGADPFKATMVDPGDADPFKATTVGDPPPVDPHMATSTGEPPRVPGRDVDPHSRTSAGEPPRVIDRGVDPFKATTMGEAPAPLSIPSDPSADAGSDPMQVLASVDPFKATTVDAPPLASEPGADPYRSTQPESVPAPGGAHLGSGAGGGGAPLGGAAAAAMEAARRSQEARREAGASARLASEPTVPTPQPGRPGASSPGTLEAPRIAGFEDLRPLGSGGMATVFRAHQVSLDRPVAIKILDPDLVPDQAFVARFQREARALASFCHPHIVSVHDMGEADGTYYLIMEFVPGHTLREILTAEGGRLPLQRTLAVMRQVAAALEHVHERGVVHRDVKPANIFVGSGDMAKVGDFGLAGVGDTNAGLTAYATPLGTSMYMAPECRVDARAADARADVYSFGVMLYEVLTGEYPVGVYQPLSEVLPGCPPALDGLVQACLKPRLEQRLDSMSRARSALEASFASVAAGGVDLAAAAMAGLGARKPAAPAPSAGAAPRPTPGGAAGPAPSQPGKGEVDPRVLALAQMGDPRAILTLATQPGAGATRALAQLQRSGDPRIAQAATRALAHRRQAGLVP